MLTLHCTCGRAKAFRGADAGAVIQEIDAAGWEDQPDSKGEFTKGHTPGMCDECVSEADENDPGMYAGD
ncbi:MAG: hypothetical protein GY851_03490 [bacterium]|nr:hypothetical protein [bacterium]